ncbi:hypothetical protein LNO81_18145 [Klebsiella variicola subsp. variicola]|nr:hypothetical protein [Klebsiella variicola subsp. variicola]
MLTQIALTDENADYCVAIGTTTLLPERFAEYVKIINLIQYPFVCSAWINEGQYVEFMMHLHPLLFLGGFTFIVPGIYIAIGTTIVVTRPAAQPQPHATEVSPWLLAWLTGEGTWVIQLAMFSLLGKKYPWIPEAGQVLANGRYANQEMNVIERILFDHFEVRKPWS